MSSLARAHIPKPLEKTSAVGLVQRQRSLGMREQGLHVKTPDRVRGVHGFVSGLLGRRILLRSHHHHRLQEHLR